MTLHGVPDRELAALAALGVTHVWMMGVWPGGPLARECGLRADVRAQYDESLPGWTEADVAASPYAVAGFTVALELGGDAGLAAFRSRLAAHGMRLLLDFVPNHLGLDHPWIRERPELFVSTAMPFPGTFASGGRYIAHGKDPYFPPWTDTAQLDYRKAATRDAMQAALLSIADRCDGVRCDMAMLVVPDVFERTWGPSPSGESWEFWSSAGTVVRRVHPDFMFLAEAYWGLEGRLCELSMDFAYDKHLYDLVVHGRSSEIQAHVLASDRHHRAHFLENHDEPRAAATLDLDHHRAALTLVLGLPGMRLVHDGQLVGRRRFSRIRLARRPADDRDDAVAALYAHVIPAFAASLVGRGKATVLVPQRAWDDNPTAQFFTIVEWAGPDRFDLVVVNAASHRAQCRVTPTVPGLAAHTWQLIDRLGDERWVRDGHDMATHGLFLDLPARGAQLFAFKPITSTVRR